MAIRYINVGLIDKKRTKCKRSEHNDVILQPETTMYWNYTIKKWNSL